MTGAAATSVRPGAWTVALIVIGLVGCALRFVGLSWGLPYPLHPDEGVILARVATMSWGNLDPGFFIYPGLFIYQVFLLDRAVALLGGEPWRVIYAARVLTALYGVATIAFVYLIGARLAGRRAGVIAAGLTAATGALTLHAHYAVTDTPAAAIATAAVWLSVRAWQRGSRAGLFMAAAAAGLAVSTKYSVAPVCIAPWLGLMALAARAHEPLARRAAATMLLAAASVAAFLVTSPYTVLDYRTFVEDMATESHLQARARAGFHVDPAENVGWNERALTQNAAAAFDDLGAAAFVLVLVGMATSLVALPATLPALRRGDPTPMATATNGGVEQPPDPAAAADAPLPVDQVGRLMVIAWVLGYFVFMAPSAIGGQRYMVPVYPAAMVLASLAIDGVGRTLGRRATGSTAWMAGAAVAALALLAAAMPLGDALSSTRLLAQRDTRLVARAWILANIPQRSHLAREFYAPAIHTDDNYRLSQPFSLTEHPIETYCKERVDYLVLSSLNAARYLGNDEPRFAEERTWYARLDERTRVVHRVEGAGSLELHHPTIEIRRLFCPEG